MPLAIWTPGLPELLVILVLGLILFGGNLPEVGKSIGKGLTEFRKGLKDLKQESGFDEIEKARDELLDSARTIDPRRMLEEEPPDAEFRTLDEDRSDDGEDLPDHDDSGEGGDEPAGDEAEVPRRDADQGGADAGATGEAGGEIDGEGGGDRKTAGDDAGGDRPPTFGYERRT